MQISRRNLLQMAAAAPVLAQGAKPVFEGNFESLAQYKCPDWFRNGKFGIWAHWGPQCVPKTGDWYARNMYIEGSPQYKYHVEHYGHPSKVGFKDIVTQWKAEKFDPEALITRYKAAGARYFVSMGIHHDNFDIWNSKHHKWNAVQMGPKKDIVGMWAKAARKAGLRFGVTEHLERTWSWFNVNKGADKEGQFKGVPYDGNDPKYADFYLPPHEDNSRAFPLNPPDSWKKEWQARITDLIDQHEPDLLYTDGGIPFGEVGKSLVAHFYNQSIKRNKGKLEAVYNIKNVHDNVHGEFDPRCCIYDLERGYADKILDLPWQTDTCIGDWFYKAGMQYKSAQTVVHMLADIVSKNGNLLLNFPLLPDGTLDAEESIVLEGITKWMASHGEAIHDTRPWTKFGEGPTQASGGMFSERSLKQYTAQDFRFTKKGEVLYAICLGVPTKQALIQSLAENAPQKVQRVELLGRKQALKFQRSGQGLTVEMPADVAPDLAVVFKVS
ncbi:alpha-L-fucosidase [Paludibaculum fermentans]|uniref:alpha-L-fucosidase n=1 Tax=Paludibaculum fermentans TaxID=1473598 RepID=UPI003EB7D5CE